MDHIDHCNALKVEVERFAVAMSQTSGAELVATCPGWTVDDVALHLGVIHRWAEELVRTRSTVRIPRTTPSLDEVSVSPDWIRDGGGRLVATLRGADPDDEMWAWGLDQHVRFWSRRQVHETLVHRIDVELVAGVEPTADSELAGDAVDEFLRNLQKVTNASVENALCGSGEQLVFRASDTDATWSVTLRDGGFDLTPSMGHHDVVVEGSSLELLLMIVRRRPLRDAQLDVTGDPNLVDFWLANSAFD